MPSKLEVNIRKVNEDGKIINKTYLGKTADGISASKQLFGANNQISDGSLVTQVAKERVASYNGSKGQKEAETSDLVIDPSKLMEFGGVEGKVMVLREPVRKRSPNRDAKARNRGKRQSAGDVSRPTAVSKERQPASRVSTIMDRTLINTRTPKGLESQVGTVRISERTPYNNIHGFTHESISNSIPGHFNMSQFNNMKRSSFKISVGNKEIYEEDMQLGGKMLEVAVASKNVRSQSPIPDLQHINGAELPTPVLTPVHPAQLLPQESLLPSEDRQQNKVSTSEVNARILPQYEGAA